MFKNLFEKKNSHRLFFFYVVFFSTFFKNQVNLSFFGEIGLWWFTSNGDLFFGTNKWFSTCSKSLKSTKIAKNKMLTWFLLFSLIFNRECWLFSFTNTFSQTLFRLFWSFSACSRLGLLFDWWYIVCGKHQWARSVGQ